MLTDLKKEKVDWTLRFMQEGLNDKMTDEERTELLNRPEVSNWDSIQARFETIDAKIGDKEMTILIIDGDFREVEDLFHQMAIMAKYLFDTAKACKEMWHLKPLVMPVFAWDNFWNNRESFKDNDLLKRTALSMLFTISGSLSDLKQ